MNFPIPHPDITFDFPGIKVPLTQRTISQRMPISRLAGSRNQGTAKVAGRRTKEGRAGKTKGGWPSSVDKGRIGFVDEPHARTRAGEREGALWDAA